MNIFETSYTEYLRAKKSGLRREAMTALNAFLAACEKSDTVAKRQIVKDFFTRQSAEDIEKAFALLEMELGIYHCNKTHFVCIEATWDFPP